MTGRRRRPTTARWSRGANERAHGHLFLLPILAPPRASGRRLQAARSQRDLGVRDSPQRWWASCEPLDQPVRLSGQWPGRLVRGFRGEVWAVANRSPRRARLPHPDSAATILLRWISAGACAWTDAGSGTAPGAGVWARRASARRRPTPCLRLSAAHLCGCSGYDGTRARRRPSASPARSLIERLHGGTSVPGPDHL